MIHPTGGSMAARYLARLLAAAALALPALAHADEPEPSSAASPALLTEGAFERFRWYGEELIYSVQILGSEGARAGLAAGFPEEVDGVMVTPLHGLVQSVGLLAGVFSIDDTADTWIEPATGLPVRAVKELNERGQFRSYDVSYHQHLHRADVERVRDGRPGRFFRFVPSDLYDALSWIYDLRSRDFAVGNQYVYHIYDGWKLSRLTIRVVRHRIVITGMGNIQAAEVEFVREVLGSNQAIPWVATTVALPPVYLVNEAARRVGVGWISLDERRLPLGVAIDTPIGSIRILLDDHTPPDPRYRPDPRLAQPDPDRIARPPAYDLPSEEEAESAPASPNRATMQRSADPSARPSLLRVLEEQEARDGDGAVEGDGGDQAPSDAP